MCEGERVPLDGAAEAQVPEQLRLLLRRHAGQLQVGGHRRPLHLQQRHHHQPRGGPGL